MLKVTEVAQDVKINVSMKEDFTQSSLCQKSKARIRKTQKQQYNKRGG